MQYINNNTKLEVKDEVFTPVRGVKLKKGLFKEVFDQNIRYLKTFNLKDMSYWFDVKAGREPEGKPYRGHFEDNLKGQTAYMFLMGAANALRWIEDDELNEKTDWLLHLFEEAQEPDGFLMPIEKRVFPTREYPHYVRIWLTYALIACELAGKEKAVKLLERWQKWFNHSKELPIIKYLELSFQGIVASTAAYLSGVGSPKDITVAQKYYEEDWRLAQFIFREKDAVHIRNQPGIEPHAHGSELESFEGYLDLYRATGAYYYLNAVMGAIELYKKHWQHPGGGIVMCEHQKAYPGCAWLNPVNKYNELCCSSFWMHIHQRLHRLEPLKEAYVSEIEKSIYNVAIANQDQAEGIRYFAHMEGILKRGDRNTCCCGVGTRIFSSLPEYIYSVSEEKLMINLFAASSIDWEAKGGIVKIDMDTNVPMDYKVKIRIRGNGDKLPVYIRVPGWASKPYPLYIDGKKYIDACTGEYVKLEKKWTTSEITFEIPTEFRMHGYEGAETASGYSRYCYEKGPLLYTFEGRQEFKQGSVYAILMDSYDPYSIEKWLEETAHPLIYKIKGKPGYCFKPYYMAEDRPICCYPLFAERDG